MLAQNFKTPADLGIKDVEFDALLKVLGMLERGEIEHGRRLGYNDGDDRLPVAFNMASFFGVGECGTVSCLGGWAEFIGKLRKNSLVTKRFRNRQLMALFEPNPYDEVDCEHSEITTAQAAIALRNYLTHGEPRWAEALRA